MGLVWLLLIGGLRIVLVRNINSDEVDWLMQNTWIPRVVGSRAGWRSPWSACGSAGGCCSATRDRAPGPPVYLPEGLQVLDRRPWAERAADEYPVLVAHRDHACS
jgi:hypothetical protein